MSRRVTYARHSHGTRQSHRTARPASIASPPLPHPRIYRVHHVSAANVRCAMHSFYPGGPLTRRCTQASSSVKVAIPLSKSSWRTRSVERGNASRRRRMMRRLRILVWISRNQRKVRFLSGGRPSYRQPGALAATRSPSPPKVGEFPAKLESGRVFIPPTAKNRAPVSKKRRVIESDGDEAPERE